VSAVRAFPTLSSINDRRRNTFIYLPKELTMSMTQNGIFTVGSNPQDKTNPVPNLKTVFVSFNPAFPTGSNVVVTANAIAEANSKYPDTFGVTIHSVNNQGFTANVYRVDNILTAPQGQGWMQQLQLGWIAQTI
jgi:hypothetical protein